MSTNLISWDSYFPGGSGADGNLGIDGNTLFLDVLKAMDITPGLPHTGQTDVRALAVEDLSGTLASAEMTEKQLTFWKTIPKEEAYSLDVEFSRLDTFGEDGTDAFIAGNDAGIVTDPRFTRAVKTVKYIAVKGQVTLPSQMIEAIGFRGRGRNVMDTAETIKMRELLRHAERNLWWGDTRVSPLHWEGVLQQVESGANATNRIRLDLRGTPPGKNLLEDLAEISAMNNADLSNIYVPVKVLRDLRKSIFPQQRSDDPSRDGTYGASFERFIMETLNGDTSSMKILRNFLLQPGVSGGVPMDVPTVVSVNGPTAPSTVTGAASAWATPTEYAPGLSADTYQLSVVAVSKGGFSAATASAGVAATAAQQITWTINSADASILYFYLFRNDAGKASSVVTNRKFLTRVARTGAATTFADTGYNVPGTSRMCALSMNAGEVVFKQLLPVVRRPLPQDLMANSWGILLFGTPMVKVPTHNIVVTNVGEFTTEGIASV